MEGFLWTSPRCGRHLSTQNTARPGISTMATAADGSPRYRKTDGRRILQPDRLAIPPSTPALQTGKRGPFPAATGLYQPDHEATKHRQSASWLFCFGLGRGGLREAPGRPSTPPTPPCPSGSGPPSGSRDPGRSYLVDGQLAPAPVDGASIDVLHHELARFEAEARSGRPRAKTTAAGLPPGAGSPAAPPAAGRAWEKRWCHLPRCAEAWREGRIGADQSSPVHPGGQGGPSGCRIASAPTPTATSRRRPTKSTTFSPMPRRDRPPMRTGGLSAASTTACATSANRGSGHHPSRREAGAVQWAPVGPV